MPRSSSSSCRSASRFPFLLLCTCTPLFLSIPSLLSPVSGVSVFASVDGFGGSFDLVDYGDVEVETHGSDTGSGNTGDKSAMAQIVLWMLLHPTEFFVICGLIFLPLFLLAGLAAGLMIRGLDADAQIQAAAAADKEKEKEKIREEEEEENEKEQEEEEEEKEKEEQEKQQADKDDQEDDTKAEEEDSIRKEGSESVRLRTRNNTKQ